MYLKKSRVYFSLFSCIGVLVFVGGVLAQEKAEPTGADFHFEKVTFDVGGDSIFSRGIPIHGYYSGSTLERTVGIAILSPACEGLLTPDGSQVKRKYFRMARFLSAGGFAVLAVDGFNPRGVAEICTKTKLSMQIKESDRYLDALAGLKYMRTRHELRDLPAITMGWGASGVIPGLQKTADTQQFAAGIAYYGECERVPTPYRPAVPLLAMGGDKDEWNPVRFCVDLAAKVDKAGPPMEVHVMENAYHSFDQPQGEPKMNSVNPKLGMVGRSESATKESFRLVADFLSRLFGFQPRAAQ